MPPCGNSIVRAARSWAMSAVRAQIPASSFRPMSRRWIPRAMSMSAKSDEGRAYRNSCRPRTRTGETMRKVFGIMTLVLVPLASYAADNGLKWAYPVEPPPGNNADAAPPSRPINQALIATTYTGLPKMPEVVAKGKPLPCMQCHLANGGSHPESAAISGLTVNYIIEQGHAFRDGERIDTRTGRMVLASKAISEKELKEAAEYYAAIGPERQKWIKTVVSNEVPKGPAPFGGSGSRYPAADG